MKLTKYAKAVKNELSIQLQKQGKTLEDFEWELSSVNTGEGALKVAATQASLFDPSTTAGGILGAIPDFAMKASLATGAAAGLTMDEMDGSVDKLNKALDREREKIHMIKRLTHNLKKEHGLI